MRKPHLLGCNARGLVAIPRLLDRMCSSRRTTHKWGISPVRLVDHKRSRVTEQMTSVATMTTCIHRLLKVRSKTPLLVLNRQRKEAAPVCQLPCRRRVLCEVLVFPSDRKVDTHPVSHLSHYVLDDPAAEPSERVRIARYCPLLEDIAPTISTEFRMDSDTKFFIHCSSDDGRPTKPEIRVVASSPPWHLSPGAPRVFANRQT